MKHVAILLFLFLIVAPGYGQVRPVIPDVPDSLLAQNELLVGQFYEKSYPYFTQDSLLIRGKMVYGDVNYLVHFGIWAKSKRFPGPYGGDGDDHVLSRYSPGFQYGGDAFRIGYAIQIFDNESDDKGHVFITLHSSHRCELAAGVDTSPECARWKRLVSTGKLVIGTDTLAFSDGLNTYTTQDELFTEKCFMSLYQSRKFFRHAVCWPEQDVLFNNNDIVNVGVVGKPMLAPPGSVAGLSSWQHRTTTGSRVAGAVWLSWRIPIDDPDPLEQVRIEKEQGIHYEYRVLRDGDREWQTLLLEDTRLGTVEEARTIFGTKLYQRRTYLVTNLDPTGEYSFCIRAVNASGTSDETCNLDTITPVAVESGEIPETTHLAQNYPNPFNPSTRITYELSQAAPVRLQVFDMTGRTVATLVNGLRASGQHTERFSVHDLPTGTYIYRLTTGTETFTRIMTLIR